MIGRIWVGLINVYQLYFRSALPKVCRFSPSCSEYAKQAVIRYGFLLGFLKAGKRLLFCHPFSNKSGYDPLT